MVPFAPAGVAVTISEVTIRGFRGIRQGTVSGLRPLTVMTGPNGCGKSAVLDALLIAASDDVGAAVVTASTRHPNVRGTRWLPYRGDASDGAAKVGAGRVAVELRPEKESLRVTRGERALEIRDGAVVSDNRDLLPSRPGSGPTRDAVRASLIDPGVPVPLLDSWSRLAHGGDRAKRRVFTALEAIAAGAVMLELVLDEQGSPALHVSYADRSVPLALAGDGVQAAVQLLLQLAVVPTGGLALIEEPEVFQHPRTLHHTAATITETVRRGVQVVCTTHSLELIDELVAAHGAHEMAVVHLRLDGGVLTSVVTADDDLQRARDGGFVDLR